MDELSDRIAALQLLSHEASQGLITLSAEGLLPDPPQQTTYPPLSLPDHTATSILHQYVLQEQVRAQFETTFTASIAALAASAERARDSTLSQWPGIADPRTVTDISNLFIDAFERRAMTLVADLEEAVKTAGFFMVKKRKSSSDNRFDEETKDLLEATFAITPHPTHAARKALSDRSGLTLKQVSVWFQNARARRCHVDEGSERPSKMRKVSSGSERSNSQDIEDEGSPVPSLSSSISFTSTSSSTTSIIEVQEPTQWIPPAVSIPFTAFDSSFNSFAPSPIRDFPSLFPDLPSSYFDFTSIAPQIDFQQILTSLSFAPSQQDITPSFDQDLLWNDFFNADWAKEGSQI